MTSILEQLDEVADGRVKGKQACDIARAAAVHIRGQSSRHANAGRRTAYTTEQWRALWTYAAEHNNWGTQREGWKAAADHAGIPYGTLVSWLRRIGDHRGVAGRIAAGAEPVEEMRRAVERKAGVQ